MTVRTTLIPAATVVAAAPGARETPGEGRAPAGQRRRENCR